MRCCAASSGVWRELRRDNPVVGSKVLVTLGGSDAANLMLRVVQALEYVRLATLDATIVLGGSNPHTLELESAVAKAEVRLRLLRNVTSMPEVMAWADIAVSSAGTTALELAFMGVPTILVTVADNQRSNARACAKLEIALNLGDLAQAVSGAACRSRQRVDCGFGAANKDDARARVP